jgi:rhodanese-related sulfurtransferase
VPKQIDVATLKAMIDRGDAIYLVDVRQPWEHQIAHLPNDVLVPLDQLPGSLAPPEGALVVAYCHHGVRSLHAAAMLERIGLKVVSLAGGIDAWSLQIDREMPRY